MPEQVSSMSKSTEAIKRSIFIGALLLSLLLGGLAPSEGSGMMTTTSGDATPTPTPTASP